MKAKWMGCIATAVALALAPSTLAACEMGLGYLFVNMSGIGGDVNIQPGSDGSPTYWSASGSYFFPVGEDFFAGPGGGICSSTGDNSETDFIFGGAFGGNFWNNPEGNVGINGQAGVSYLSFDGGSEIGVPVHVLASIQAGENATVFVGPGLRITRDSFSYDAGEFGGSSDSSTDTDPMGTAGIAVGSGNATFMGAINLRKGESDTDFSFNVGARVGVE